MADGIDDLTGRVRAVEGKLDTLSASVDQRFDAVDRRFDTLSASVDQRFDAVDRRFDAIDAAIVEQRQYTEFAYERLDTKMDAGFERVALELRTLGSGLARLERKLDQFIDVHLPPSSTSPPNQP